MPLDLRVFLVVGLTVVATIGLVLASRATLGRHKMKGTGDVETAYITVTGTIYAIFLAFMIFVVWGQFYAAMVSVDQEGNTLVDIYSTAAGLPQAQKQTLRRLCIDYVHVVVRQEWPAMVDEESAPQASRVIDRMWAVVTANGSAQITDDVFRDHLLSQMVDLTNLRRARLLESRTSLPSILYACLLFGAAITILLSCLFTSQDLWPHVVKACAISALISIFLFTIWALDHPFRGKVHVSPESIERTLLIFRNTP